MPGECKVLTMDATTMRSSDLQTRTATGSAATARDFDRGWAAIALFGTGVSFLIAIGCYGARLGLPNPPLLFPLCVLIVAATLCGPLLIPARGRLAEVRHRAIMLPVVALAILLFVD